MELDGDDQMDKSQEEVPVGPFWTLFVMEQPHSRHCQCPPREKGSLCPLLTAREQPDPAQTIPAKAWSEEETGKRQPGLDRKKTPSGHCGEEEPACLVLSAQTHDLQTFH